MIRHGLESEDAASGDETFILAFCEECGRATKFPDTLREKVEECPHCGKYIDVIDSEGTSIDDNAIVAGEYLPQSELVSRRFRWLLATMCVAFFGLLIVVQIVAWKQPWRRIGWNTKVFPHT
jgi:rRNA maturation protein Nop10